MRPLCARDDRVRVLAAVTDPVAIRAVLERIPPEEAEARLAT